MQEYFDSINEEISAQFRRLQKLIGIDVSDNLEVGRYHENILGESLTRLLPQRFSIRSGYILSDHQKSGQQDILVIDENEPTVYAMKYGNFAVVRPEGVLAAIQVKTQLKTPDEFASAFQNIASAKATLVTPANTRMVSGVFVFETVEGITDDQINRMFSAVHGVQTGHYPNFIFFRSEGLLLLRFQEEQKYVYRRVFRDGVGNDAAWQLSVIVYLVLSACSGMNSGSDYWRGFLNQSGAQKSHSSYAPK